MNLLEKHLWFHQDSGVVQTLSCEAGMIVGFSERSPQKKSVNEDAAGIFIFDNQTLILAVADGMGGANCGDQAAAAIINSVASHLEHVQEKEGLRTHILDAIEKSNLEILSWGIGAGATLVVALLTDESLRVFHVGDSEALLCSNRGRLKFSTVAHSPTAMAVELGMMNEREAMEHQDRNIVTNHVGSREMRIEIGPSIRLGKRDTVLLASDGLFDNLMVTEIVELVRIQNLPQRAEAILSSTRNRMQGLDIRQSAKPDDLTVLMFRSS
jgi:PPM family protein phosphatase